MRKPYVIDTNVLLVANGQAPQVTLECKETCCVFLNEVVVSGAVIVDTDRAIFSEYLGNVRVVGQPGLGDQFFKWLWDRQGYAEICPQVEIHATGDERTYEEFPDDPALQGFDLSDRKFVAVALGSGCNPPVVNACDSDWWIFADALEANEVDVRNICPELIDE